MSTPAPLPVDAHDEHFMEQALSQAQRAWSLGDVPVGAVIVHEGRIVGEGWNAREVTQDPTAHAEMMAIQSAAAELGTWRLNDAALYVTLEPCAMCAGAIVQARISTVVFGATDPKDRAYGSLDKFLAQPHCHHLVDVRSGVLASECQAILQRFFQQLRERHTDVAYSP